MAPPQGPSMCCSYVSGATKLPQSLDGTRTFFSMEVILFQEFPPKHTHSESPAIGNCFRIHSSSEFREYWQDQTSILSFVRSADCSMKTSDHWTVAESYSNTYMYGMDLGELQSPTRKSTDHWSFGKNPLTLSTYSDHIQLSDSTNL